MVMKLLALLNTWVCISLLEKFLWQHFTKKGRRNTEQDGIKNKRNKKRQSKDTREKRFTKNNS